MKTPFEMQSVPLKFHPQKARLQRQFHAKTSIEREGTRPLCPPVPPEMDPHLDKQPPSGKPIQKREE
ncbi:uncharacterized protein BDZ83DRAFT_295309 [Colletotrichum acutatum]|uniref:Uncharacterized protein n=1 Tax=Glomerella acutata TaxID=27357 RepID=A0AAD9D325_GLOAC|nr:uncharacterized protein BDZ83DRAFT_295309 [Colletotrichum acutatum]KAK1731051.1 hypothetical protein BDZ83DRAFT_295309 [Colletotrichum acutatum]